MSEHPMDELDMILARSAMRRHAASVAASAATRADIVAHAWRIGMRNVRDMARELSVSRDVVYRDLESRGINPTTDRQVVMAGDGALEPGRGLVVAHITSSDAIDPTAHVALNLTPYLPPLPTHLAVLAERDEPIGRHPDLLRSVTSAPGVIDLVTDLIQVVERLLAISIPAGTLTRISLADTRGGYGAVVAADAVGSALSQRGHQVEILHRLAV